METSRIRIALAAAAALVAVAACAGDKQAEPFGLLSLDEVEKMVGRGDVVVVDANPDDIYRKNHVPGARWWRSAPLAKLLPAKKDVPLVFYCASPS